MEIKEVTKFEVDGRLFDSKTSAEMFVRRTEVVKMYANNLKAYAEDLDKSTHGEGMSQKVEFEEHIDGLAEHLADMFLAEEDSE